MAPGFADCPKAAQVLGEFRVDIWGTRSRIAPEEDTPDCVPSLCLGRPWFRFPVQIATLLERDAFKSASGPSKGTGSSDVVSESLPGMKDHEAALAVKIRRVISNEVLFHIRDLS